MGIHQAYPDAEIVGVDIRPMPRYPFTFVQADAMTYPLDGFDFVWASPPCQAYSVTKSLHGGRVYPQLVAAVRSRLLANGRPYVIENVVGAPLDASLELCGTMFNLRVLRHRRFETSHMVMQPWHPQHVGGTGARRGLHGQRSKPVCDLRLDAYVTVADHNFRAADGPVAMDIWHMGSRAELAQAIPPAYSRYILTALRPVFAADRSTTP